MKHFFLIFFLFSFFCSSGQMAGVISVDEMMKLYDMNKNQTSFFLQQKGYKKISSEMTTMGGYTSRFFLIRFIRKNEENKLGIEVYFPLNQNDSNKKQIIAYLNSENYSAADRFYRTFLSKLKTSNFTKIREVQASPAVDIFFETFQRDNWRVLSEKRNCCGSPLVFERYFTLTRNYEFEL